MPVPMKHLPKPLDLKRVKVYPLAERRSLSAIEKLLVDPEQLPAPCDPQNLDLIRACAETDTVINLHIGSSGSSPGTSADAPPDVVDRFYAGNALAWLGP